MQPQQQLQQILQQAFNLLQQGQHQQAEQIARQVLTQYPQQPDALNLMGLISTQNGALEQARQYFNKGLKKAPGHLHLLNSAGLVEKDLGEYARAETLFVKALKINPGYMYARHNLATVYQAQRKFAKANRLYREVIRQHPDFVDSLSNLAHNLELGHELEEARQLATRVLEISPDNYMARLTLANIALREQSFEEAIRLLSPLLQSGNLTQVNHAVFCGKCAYAHEKLGDYGAAFSHFQEANQVLFNHFEQQMINEDTIYSPQAVACIERKIPGFNFSDSSPDVKKPVFLIGFPRSGTTLLDQILSSHSQITVLEEKPNLIDVLTRFPATDEGLTALEQASEKDLDKLRRAYWAIVNREIGSGKTRPVIIDKLPLNAVALLHIARLFPGAKIITALRDPRDCVLSCYQQRFGMNPAMFQLLRLDSAVSYYGQVMSVISAVNETSAFDMHFVRYERVIGDFKGEVQSLVDFLGLEWEDALLDYQATAKSRDITTPSATQVIQPLYSSSIGKWKHFQEWIGPAFDPLDEWVETWGY